MKEKFTLLFFLLLNFLIFSQDKKQFTIDWNGTKKLTTNSFTLEVPYFSEENFSYDESNGLKFIAHWPVQGFVNTQSVRLSQVNTSPISQADLKDLPLNLIPKEYGLIIDTSIARDKKVAFLMLNPIIKKANGTFEKITSFSVDFSETFSSQRTNTLNRTISNSVLSQGNWYKFYVDTTGVFKLSKSFLERLGMNVGNVDPRERWKNDTLC